MRLCDFIFLFSLAVICKYGAKANMGAILEVNKEPPVASTPLMKDGSSTIGTDVEDEYEQVKLFEGDIVYTDTIHRMMNPSEAEEVLFDASAKDVRWTGNLFPYTFRRGDEDLKPYVDAAIKRFNEQLGSCIKFRYYTTMPRHIKNYVEFYSGGGCYSNIGMVGGKQTISLKRKRGRRAGCTKRGTVMHEIMHALGFFHEQSRSDRDKYITINFNNIKPGTLSFRIV